MEQLTEKEVKAQLIGVSILLVITCWIWIPWLVWDAIKRLFGFLNYSCEYCGGDLYTRFHRSKGDVLECIDCGKANK